MSDVLVGMNLKLYDPFGTVLVDTRFDITEDVAELFNTPNLRISFMPPDQLNGALLWHFVISKD